MASSDVPTPVAPDEVAVVRDFVNTTDLETATDDLSTRAELTGYLHEAGLLPRRTPSTQDDLGLAHQLRQGLRRALELNHDGASEPIPELDDALARLPLELRWDGASAVLAPTRSGVAGAFSLVAIAMNRAVAEHSWWRLKICSSDECEWAYYDASKNRSRNWCEYGCGNRIKVRAYRARQRSANAR